MASSKDTAAFFLKGSCEQFEHVLKLYPEALKLRAEKRSKKPEELIKLDNWYQNELPKKIKSRGKDAHLVHEELVQTMKWKQTRGKYYPQLSYLVKVNTPRAVMAETKKAFRKLPNLEQAITALSNLKGVGTTMASALLAAAAPENAPFMADECLMSIPEIGSVDYTTKEYMNFVSHIQSTVQRLNSESGEATSWSAHRVELALWTHYVATELNPDLLANVPGLEVIPHKEPNGLPNGDIEPSDESNQEPPANGKLVVDSLDDTTTSYTEDSLDKPATPIVASDETNDSIASETPSLKRSAADLDDSSITSTEDTNDVPTKLKKTVIDETESNDSTVNNKISHEHNDVPICKKPRTEIILDNSDIKNDSLKSETETQ